MPKHGDVAMAKYDCLMLPHREPHTAVYNTVTVPSNRSALFLCLETDTLYDTTCNELSFGALSPHDRATFQLLLYLTYCCKGELLQVTLENPDFWSMSPPIREDFAHGRLFCFVLDMAADETCDTTVHSTSVLGMGDDTNGDVYGEQLVGFMDMALDMDVFRGDGVEQHSAHDESEALSSAVQDVLNEAFNAFMRIQLVRKRASSLNNAMIVMRDIKGELSSMFEWVDIQRDTFNSSKVDRKKVKELQGSMYTPNYISGKQGFAVPQCIGDLTLTTLQDSLGRITDSAGKGQGKTLFKSLMSKLTGMQWLQQTVIQRAYNANIPDDVRFLDKLKLFTADLDGSTSSTNVDTRGLLVFRYSLDKLCNPEHPDAFVRSMIHRHVSVANTYMESVLQDIRSRRRTRDIADLLYKGLCYCQHRDTQALPCTGKCQMAYACFYNLSDRHPFLVSNEDYSCYFAHLYPNLGKLERLSKEMKSMYNARGQFESIAEMVFTVLRRDRFREGSLYKGLGNVLRNGQSCSLSLAHNHADIHALLYLRAGDANDYSGPGEFDPIKVYDHALVRYLFSDSLQVGRLFQASTTFNYIIANTAPRYTIERIMLFNITGPGEGKSYANNVLSYQFSSVPGCIEKLTSFTPQAFKYKHNRNACLVMIDDAHIAHQKNIRAQDKESNVIPNTFKNLLDTSTLESDVVSRDMETGKVDTIKYRSVHNCGFVWNTNTMGFVSEAWADRCVVMNSEFPQHITRTRGTKQIKDTIQQRSMSEITALCLYRQNLIQSATMIAESQIMQFSHRFDRARHACVKAFNGSHIVCSGSESRRVDFCINQLVFAEGMKLACHFVFDVWIPPWTEIPDERDSPDIQSYMHQLNANRLVALNRLTFGQLCVETNAVYKLCAAACLADICPRVVDNQGHFACKVLGYVLRQIHVQNLKSSLKDGHLCISRIDTLYFSDTEIKDGDEAHRMLMLCSTCNVPTRHTRDPVKTYKLCTYRLAPRQNATHNMCYADNKRKVCSVTVPLEAVYDILALYAPESHSGFWDQVHDAMLQAYERGEYDTGDAFVRNWDRDASEADEDHADNAREHRLLFTLDFNEDMVRSMILEATSAIAPLNQLTFNKCAMGGEVFRCSAPLYYGGVLKRAIGQDAPDTVYDAAHMRESKLGPVGTFHGPRLSVYSPDYTGVPVRNASSFCTTRTVYHQENVYLTRGHGVRRYMNELEEDWEWEDAVDVFNTVHGDNVFSVDMLKKDYASNMMVAKGVRSTSKPRKAGNLVAMLEGMRATDGRVALALRRGMMHRMPQDQVDATSHQHGHTQAGPEAMGIRKRVHVLSRHSNSKRVRTKRVRTEP